MISTETRPRITISSDTSRRKEFIITRTVALSLLLVITAYLFADAFLFDLHRVSGESMSPTFENGDIVVVFRAAYGIPMPFGDRYLVRFRGPRPGDVVTARFPAETETVIKRVAGVAGENIDLEGGELILGSRHYSLMGGDAALFTSTARVPRGSVVLLGDNRADSADSRSLGFVPVPNIYSRVSLRIGYRNVGRDR